MFLFITLCLFLYLYFYFIYYRKKQYSFKKKKHLTIVLPTSSFSCVTSSLPLHLLPLVRSRCEVPSSSSSS